MTDVKSTVIFWFLFLVTGLPGNTITLAAFALKTKKKSTDMLLIIQALVDLIACITPQIDMVKGISPCLIIVIVRLALSMASLFLTFAIAVDRYFTVCRPFGRHMTKPQAVVFATACISLSFALNVPTIWYVTVVYTESTGCIFTSLASPVRKLVKVLQIASFFVAVAVSMYSYLKVFALIRRQARVRSEMSDGGTTRNAANATSVLTTVSASIAEPVPGHQHARNGYVAHSATTDRRSTLMSDNGGVDNPDYLQIPSFGRNKLFNVGSCVETSFNNHDHTTSSTNTFHNQFQGSTDNSRPQRRIQGEKTTKMLLVTTVFLILTWLPYILISALPTKFYIYLVTKISQENVLLLFNLRGFNNMVNAFVYWAVNPLFRQDVKQVFTRLRNLCKR